MSLTPEVIDLTPPEDAFLPEDLQDRNNQQNFKRWLIKNFRFLKILISELEPGGVSREVEERGPFVGDGVTDTITLQNIEMSTAAAFLVTASGVKQSVNNYEATQIGQNVEIKFDEVIPSGTVIHVLVLGYKNPINIAALAIYSKTALPSPVNAQAQMIYVVDEVGGEQPAFSDGINWRRITDRAIVS